MNRQLSTFDSLALFCTGKWPQIIVYIAPGLKTAVTNNFGYVTCPEYGCNEYLRTLEDFYEIGGMTCNTCGTFTDGYEVLRWFCRFDDIELEYVIQNALDNIDFIPDLLR